MVKDAAATAAAYEVHPLARVDAFGVEPGDVAAWVLVVQKAGLGGAAVVELDAARHLRGVHGPQWVAHAVSLQHLQAQAVGHGGGALAIGHEGEAVATLQRAAQHQGLLLVEVERALDVALGAVCPQAELGLDVAGLPLGGLVSLPAQDGEAGLRTECQAGADHAVDVGVDGARCDGASAGQFARCTALHRQVAQCVEAGITRGGAPPAATSSAGVAKGTALAAAHAGRGTCAWQELVELLQHIHTGAGGLTLFRPTGGHLVDCAIEEVHGHDQRGRR